MSHNLLLIADKHRRLNLWQTPTAVTERIAFSGDPKTGYFAWLDEQVEARKPPDHAKCDKRTRARLTSTEEYRSRMRYYVAMLERIIEHKEEVEAFLVRNPDAKWVRG